MKYFLFIGLIFIILPLQSLAEENISRRDGFLIIWNSIKRPSKDVLKSVYTDISKSDKDFKVISYAENRGILNTENKSTKFFPSDPLLVDDALSWLFKTRNVARWDLMENRHLPSLLKKYPIYDVNNLTKNIKLTKLELEQIVKNLDDLLAKEIHEVSYYGDLFHGKGTAFGEKFNKIDFTAAHKYFPHNTIIRVTNMNNGKWVNVRINDRGPYIEGRDMDLSEAAFKAIVPNGDQSVGILYNVTFVRLGDSHLLIGSKNEYASKAVQEEDVITGEILLPPLGTTQKSSLSNSSQVSVSSLSNTWSFGEEIISMTKKTLKDEITTDNTNSIPKCSFLTRKYRRRASRNIVFERGIPYQLKYDSVLKLAASENFTVYSIIYPDLKSNETPININRGDEYALEINQLGLYKIIIADSQGKKTIFKAESVACQK